jgi:hypothetical protein
MKKLSKIIVAGILSVSFANAGDLLTKSMTAMETGMTFIQKGFLNNNAELIRTGVEMVEKGNKMFSDKDVIIKYLPQNKKHMVNVAENQARRITLDASLVNLRLDDKAYTSAANAYSDMMNACSRCHAIVRDW